METIWIDDISDEDQEILEAHGLVFDGGTVTLPSSVLQTATEQGMGWSVIRYEVDGILFEHLEEELSDRSELRIVDQGESHV